MPDAAKPMAEASGGTGSFEELPSEEAYPGVNRRSFSTQEATVSSYSFEPGASFPLHSHPQEQITLVTEGSVEMVVDGQVSSLDEGCWSVVSGGVEHGITAGPEGAAIVGMIVPRRENSDDYQLAGEEQ
ncbi:MAG: cupin domain-containing protein [Solirubrobacterales bacterium]|nr:cupin domain-containing protein [Solirubrobacterales bacterium]